MTSHPLPTLAASFLVFALTGASAADRSVPVTVVNPANASVPVIVTNSQGGAAAVPKSVVTDLFANNTANVMPAPGAGKRFVVKHFSVYMISNNSGTLLSDANCILVLHQGSVSNTIAFYALQHADVFGGLTLSQGEYLVLGPSDALDMICASNPANSSGRVTVSGDMQVAP